MRERMSSGEQASGAGAANEAAPGKRTLTESLVPVQRKATRPEGGGSADPPKVPSGQGGAAADPSKARSGQGAALDAGVQSGMGSYFGADFSNVRVHQGGAVDGMLHGGDGTAIAQ